MSAQKPLFDPPPAIGNLTERQTLAYRALVGFPDGAAADDIGARLHSARGKHPADKSCNWCAADGYGVLCELRAKGLAKERRGVGWVAIAGPLPGDAGSAAADEEADPWPDGY